MEGKRRAKGGSWLKVQGSWRKRFRRFFFPGAGPLLETAALFLPAIPAYLWLWPNVTGAAHSIAEGLANVYAMGVVLFVGLRRWNLDQLGLNDRGFFFSLTCGLVLIAGRTLLLLSIDWGVPAPHFGFSRILGEIFFDFMLVGVGQELLFRGLIYRALQDWIGVGWAIIGSSLAFGLWHVFGQGPLIGAATAFYGLVFALVRWRTGSIIGLICVHGLLDYATALILPETVNVVSVRPAIPHPLWLALGLALIVLVPIYIWKIHPLAERAFPAMALFGRRPASPTQQPH